MKQVLHRCSGPLRYCAGQNQKGATELESAPGGGFPGLVQGNESEGMKELARDGNDAVAETATLPFPGELSWEGRTPSRGGQAGASGSFFHTFSVTGGSDASPSLRQGFRLRQGYDGQGVGINGKK